MTVLAPTYTADLLLPLHELLIGVLRTLQPEEWEAATVAGRWRVRDVAAHLLDGDLRRLSAQRDGYVAPRPVSPDGYGEMVRFLDRLNAAWIEAARRLSPGVILELLEREGAETARLLASLPPHDTALWPVMWAGDGRSEHWMDTGREYTERWHHQMQIRDAVRDRHPELALVLLQQEWFEPLLDMSVRVLPHAYRATTAGDGDAVTLEVVSPPGVAAWHEAWSLVRDGDAWRLEHGAVPAPRTRVTMDADACWRIFYNAPPRAGAPAPVIDGDRALAEPLLRARSVMV